MFHPVVYGLNMSPVLGDQRHKLYGFRGDGVFTIEYSITQNPVTGDGIPMVTTSALTLVLTVWVKRGDIVFLDDMYS